MSQQKQARAVVVGSGIGGLTAAVALHQRGWQVTVLERAESLDPVGAGIGLAPNSLRALDVIGLGGTVRDLAAWQGEGGMRAPNGRWLSRTDSAAASERFGGPLVLLHRATLVDVLRSALPGDIVRTGAAATLVDAGEPGGRPAVVRTEAGDLQADLVIGADGVRSGVRGVLFPAYPGAVYAGFTTWRVVVPAPAEPFPPHETWGRGRLWGTQPLKDGRIYAYAAAHAAVGGRSTDGEKAELLRRFGDWHHPVPQILAAAEDAKVLRHDVFHMSTPLDTFHKGRTVLIGDAAHAMCPTMGQGGNQSIEDGVVLGQHLDPAASQAQLGAALAAFTADRLPRTTGIVAKSAKIAKLAMLDSAPAAAVRDTLLRLASLGPSALALRAFDGVCDWQPPQRTYAARTPVHQARQAHQA
ncbi:FAD-dependent monooxygenase [Streptomyces sp. NPDC051561]|uniref:FAD-dependent monooxygenase n=1 Tax=Streptomyces sp. NPDC051561 TaxID=3365658 RepID=UPI0037B7BBC5